MSIIIRLRTASISTYHSTSSFSLSLSRSWRCYQCFFCPYKSSSSKVEAIQMLTTEPFIFKADDRSPLLNPLSSIEFSMVSPLNLSQSVVHILIYLQLILSLHKDINTYKIFSIELAEKHQNPQNFQPQKSFLFWYYRYNIKIWCLMLN